MDYNITITQKIVLCNTFKKKRRENIFVAAVHEDFGRGERGEQIFQKNHQNIIDKICKTYYNNRIILEGVANA